MKESHKKVLNYTISIIVLIVCIYYSFRDINLSTLWGIILNVNYIWVIVPIPVIFLSHWVRAMRWKTMLNPIKKVKSVWNLFSAVMVGYAVNGVTPRGGEFVRPYIFSRREKVPFSTSFATIVVERFIDLFTLLLLLAFVFIFLSGKIMQAMPKVSVNGIIISILLTISVLVLSFYPPVIRLILKFIIKPLSDKLYRKVSSIFDKFVEGFAIIKTPSQYFRLIAESLAIWLFYTLPLYFMFFSFQSLSNLNFDDAILMIVVSGVATTLSPTPGAVGGYHFAVQYTLMKIYGISSEEALAYATLTHGINYIIQMLLGGIFFLRENIKKLPKEIGTIEEELGKE